MVTAVWTGLQGPPLGQGVTVVERVRVRAPFCPLVTFNFQKLILLSHLLLCFTFSQLPENQKEFPSSFCLLLRETL